MDNSKLIRAAELEAEAAALRAAAFKERPLPDFWRVGQKVRFIRDIEYGFRVGEVAEIVEVRDGKKPAHEYQVFWTSPSGGKSKFWTTPDDVELVI